MNKFNVGDRVRMTRVASNEFTDIPATVVRADTFWLTIAFDRPPGFGWPLSSYEHCWNIPAESVALASPQLELFEGEMK